MSDPTPAAGAPETRGLPLAAITGTFLHRAWLKSGRPDPLLDDDAWDGFALTLQALAQAERLTAPEPSLLAAVEALPAIHPVQRGMATDHPTYPAYIELDAVLALIESRATSREAGLDAERLAEAIDQSPSAVFWRVNDGDDRVAEVRKWAADIAAEYARLATSPVTEGPM